MDKLKELQDALERLQNLRADVIKTEGMGGAEQTKVTGLGRLSHGIIIVYILNIPR